jgi:flagellar biosynthesis component FlhA
MYVFLAALLFALIWGTAENRLFCEQDVGWEIFDHFKPYHLFLVALTVLIAFLGSEGSIAKFMFLSLWTVLMLDVTWWLIRYRDFTVNENAAIQKYFGETNSWHMQTDWDNCPLPVIGKPKLVYGCYWWWWLFAGLLFLLGLHII